MKRFVEGVDRGQSTLFPECLDDWIGEENPIRVIDVFVDELDLAALGFSGVDPEATGRPSYHPAVLLKLYIYGYLNRVQSSRRLEREAGRNVEVMWLTGRLVPDHKTIAEFRKDNGRAIRQVCARVVVLCRTMGLFTEASVAIDGSKFKAVNNRDRNFTRAKMARRRAQIEASVARYPQQLDTADRQEPSEALATKTTGLREKIAKLGEEMQRLQALEARMLATPDQQRSLTDPDARAMATSGRGSRVVGDNVQAAVDLEHHLIVAHDVTNVGIDVSQLAPMAQLTKAALEIDRLEVVADRGYFSSEQILACEAAGVTVTLPKPQTSGNRVKGTVRQARLPLRSVGGRVRVPCRRQAHLPLYQPGKMDGCCAAIGPAHVKPAPSRTAAHPAGNGASPDGSMSTWSKRSSVGSTRIRRRCVNGARRPCIPSARSRPG